MRDGSSAGYRYSEIVGPAPADVLKFQRDIFERRYGLIPDDGHDADSVFLVARDAGENVVASLRVLPADKRPFSFERVLDASLVDAISPRPAEIGRWCVSESHRNVAFLPDLHLGLMKLVLGFAHRQGVTDYLICVYPEMERFYRGLYFEPTDLRFRHPDWGDVALYRMNILKAVAKFERSRAVLAAYLLNETDDPLKTAEK